MDKVSVIIPTYKRPENLIRAINSVLLQSYKNIEIIVIDDNNEGDEYRLETEELMKQFEYDNRVIYLKHKINKNGAAARNKGIKYVKSKYVAFLDDDDEFKIEKIRKQVEKLKSCRGKFHACYCGYEQQKNLKLVQKIIRRDEGDLREKLLLGQNTIAAGSTLLIKTSVLKELNGFDENFTRHQDWELLMRYFRKYKICVINEPLAILHRESVLNKPTPEKFCEIKETFLSGFDKDIRSLDKGREILKHQWLEVTKVFIRSKKYKRSLFFLKRASKFSKISFRERLLILLEVLNNYIQIIDFLKKIRNIRRS